MNRDTRYLKRERWDDGDGFDLSMRQCASLWAAAPSGSRRQRAALAWLRRKSPTRAAECAERSRESDASLARKLDAIDAPNGGAT